MQAIVSKPLSRFVGFSGMMLVLAGCGGTTPPAASDAAIDGNAVDAQGTQLAVRFRGSIGGAPFRCGQSFANLGSTRTNFVANDFRFYISAVRLLGANGVEVPFTMTTNAFQSGGIALLDFETGGSGCQEGNTATNFEINGTAASAGPYTGIKFVLGIPDAQNYVNAATQPSPLNLTSMFWSWTTGYKFARIEGTTTGMPNGFLFHLGNPVCTTSPRDASCVSYRPEITLTGADPTTTVIDADLARLFANIDMDNDAGGAPGCMSDPGDPTCAPIFTTLGLPDSSSQSFFAWMN